MRYLTAILCLFVFSGMSAQPVVRASFQGQVRTDTQILIRLAEHPLGAPLDTLQLATDLRRLRSLETVIGASYYLDTLPEGLHLIYRLREGVSRLPILGIGGLQNNFWWEAGYTDRNWRGRAEELTLLARKTDGRLGGMAYYRKPYIGKSRWGMGLLLESYASREPLYFGSQQVDYEYRNNSLRAQLFYHLRPEERFVFSFTYFTENFLKVDPELIPGPDAQLDVKQLLHLGYRLGLVYPDLLQPRGIDLNLTGELVLQAGKGSAFYLFRARLRGFRPIGKKGALAGRLALGYATNENSPFAPFVVDSRVNIRGSGNRIDRGTAAATLNLEYRRQLFKCPWLYGQGVAFNDMGTWRDPGGDIRQLWSEHTLQHFAGLGLRLISPKANNAVLRLDYGWSLRERGNRGVVIGLGQYF